MSDLLDDVISAHGGLARWRELNEVKTSIVTQGALWGIKGVVQDAEPREMTVSLHEERASVHPFGAPDQRTNFTADRIAIEKLDGRVVAEQDNPHETFEGHGLTTQWSPLQRAYFNGYALWTYLTTPFLLTMPGFSVTEIEPRQENGERWRGLRAQFPAEILSHSPIQDFYFGEDNLLRRHDYQLDIAGESAAAQYVYDYVEADGIRLPTKRRAYLRDASYEAITDKVMVAIDLSDVRFR
jgi:hypothetical protein